MKKIKSLKTATVTNQGFTLVELLICIAIIAILLAIAIPTFMAQTEKAKIAVLKHNTQIVHELILVNSLDYSKDKWQGAYNDNNDETLNNFIESTLEKMNGSTYENKINLINPYSKKLSILDYGSTLGSGDGKNPALFLTANSNYSYAGSGSTNNIRGTIVAYFQVSGGVTDHIEIYFVDGDGAKSDSTMRIE